jgi:hypothetical protein
MVEEDIYQNIKNEEVSKSFSLDNETLDKIKEFMKKNDRYNFSESITDLINLGLAALGYTDKEKALDRFTFKGDLPDVDIFKIPKDSKMVVYEIIKKLSQKSIDRNAHRTQILLEARAKGISSSKTTQILEGLKRNAEIYEPIKDNFKISEY